MQERLERIEDVHDYQISSLLRSVKKKDGRKRFRPDDDPDEEYVPSLDLYHEQFKVEVRSVYFSSLTLNFVLYLKI